MSLIILHTAAAAAAACHCYNHDLKPIAAHHHYHHQRIAVTCTAASLSQGYKPCRGQRRPGKGQALTAPCPQAHALVS